MTRVVHLPANLTADNWICTELWGQRLAADDRPALRFNQNGAVLGTGGFGHFLGVADTHGNEMRLWIRSAKRMLDPAEALQQDENFRWALNATRLFDVQPDRLRLTGEDGTTVAVFERGETAHPEAAEAFSAA